MMDRRINDIIAGQTRALVVTTVVAYAIPADVEEIIFNPDTGATPFTATLPPARENVGRIILLRIMGANAATSTATIAANGADRIALAATPILDTAEDWVALLAWHGVWLVIDGLYT